jgi:hypothetical protein
MLSFFHDRGIDEATSAPLHDGFFDALGLGGVPEEDFDVDMFFADDDGGGGLSGGASSTLRTAGAVLSAGRPVRCAEQRFRPR